MKRNLCLNLFGTLWTRNKAFVDIYVVNHERIHTRQQQEMLFIPFYLFYVVEWIVKLIKYKNWDTAYRNISFEREAYRYGDDLSYLPRRKPYYWVNFLNRRP